MSRVGLFIPKEMQHDLSGMSPKYLMHAQEDEFEHKVVFVAEYEGVSNADYSIRTFQSEKKIEWKFVDTGKGIKAKTNVVKGPAAFIQATTRPVLHPENETRLLFIQMDESKDQTREILKCQAEEAEMEQTSVLDANLFNSYHELIRNLQCTKIKIPFAKGILPHFPSDQVRSRRDFSKLLGLIKASAFLNQHQREYDGDAIIASIEDYTIAREFFEHTYGIGPQKTLVELLEAAKSFGRPFIVPELMEKVDWKKSFTYEVLG